MISKADEFLQRNQPVVSVDTKKKEWVGDFQNGGREWQPKGQPERSLTHDFPRDGAGKAIPYGIYDMGRNEAWVSVGCVVGNARYGGKAIAVDEFTAELGERAGLACQETRAVRRRGNSAQQMGKYGRAASRESVVIFEKR